MGLHEVFLSPLFYIVYSNYGTEDGNMTDNQSSLIDHFN